MLLSLGYEDVGLGQPAEAMMAVVEQDIEEDVARCFDFERGDEGCVVGLKVFAHFGVVVAGTEVVDGVHHCEYPGWAVGGDEGDGGVGERDYGRKHGGGMEPVGGLVSVLEL